MMPCLSGCSGDGKPLSNKDWLQMRQEMGKLTTDLDLVDVADHDLVDVRASAD
jgi:hypothetical protein